MSAFEYCAVCRLNVERSDAAAHRAAKDHRGRLNRVLEREKERVRAMHPLLRKCIILEPSRTAGPSAHGGGASHNGPQFFSIDVSSSAADDSPCRAACESVANLADRGDECSVLLAKILSRRSLFCSVCALEIALDTDTYRGSSLFRHYAGNRHDKALSRFLSLNQLERKQRVRLKLTKGAVEKFAARCAIVDRRGYTLKAEDHSRETPPLTETSAGQMKSTEERMNEHQNSMGMLRNESSAALLSHCDEFGLRRHIGPRDNRVIGYGYEAVPKPPVYIAENGVRQCATGWIQEERVWGGGIVRVSDAQFAPWPMDIADEAAGYAANQQVMGSGAIPENYGAATSGVTASASSAAPPPWAAGSAISGTGEVERWADVSPAVKEAVARANALVKKGLKSGRLGTGFDPESVRSSQSFLPNFGGPWESGPRSQTAVAFREKRAARKR